MISCTECMISCIANMISYATSEHTCRSGPKSGRAGSWPLGRASALLLSQCCPLSNAARYGPLSAFTSVPIMIADSCPPVRRCCPRFRMHNRVGIRLLIQCQRESRSAGTILWRSGRARTRRQWLVVVVRRPPRGCRPFWRRGAAARYHSPSLRFKKAMYSDFLTALSLSNRRLEHVGCDLLGVA